jgi:hypothetical protein
VITKSKRICQRVRAAKRLKEHAFRNRCGLLSACSCDVLSQVLASEQCAPPMDQPEMHGTHANTDV